MNISPKALPPLIFTVRLFPEITIKSPSVRKRWTKHLCENIRVLARRVEPRTSVVQDWDRIEVRVPGADASARVGMIDLLARIPGIANYSEVKSFKFDSLEDIYQRAHQAWADELPGKTFCVRVKRVGHHDFTSTQAEVFIGGELNQNVQTAGVKLKNPDITVHIEIKNHQFFIVDGKYAGLGGFPMGTQESVLSLVSGGFDSTVASYMMIKRGIRTHYCFFNLGGRAHEVAVKEVAYYLWQKYASTHRVRFITVPFEGVVKEIMEKVDPSNMGVILKRMMLRAADKVAEKGGIEALVTGEAVAQVSSQTIPNLSIIDRVTEKLTLRPLIVTDKMDIIKVARQIGAEGFSASIPEYCGVISVKPSARVKLSSIERDEELFDFDVLDEALGGCRVQFIDQLMKGVGDEVAIEKVSELPDGAIVIDIRHPDERELRPLAVADHPLLCIPFYTLDGELVNLDAEACYYLFCERGVMSELHAGHFHDAGLRNVAVYRPDLT